MRFLDRTQEGGRPVRGKIRTRPGHTPKPLAVQDCFFSAEPRIIASPWREVPVVVGAALPTRRARPDRPEPPFSARVSQLANEAAAFRSPLARLIDSPHLARVVSRLPAETLHELIRHYGLECLWRNRRFSNTSSADDAFRSRICGAALDRAHQTTTSASMWSGLASGSNCWRTKVAPGLREPSGLDDHL